MIRGVPRCHCRHVLLCCGFLLGCAASAPHPGPPLAADLPRPGPAGAIRAVLQADEEAAQRRNHASESVPLHEAIDAYLDELEALDYEDCPEDFTAAFHRHRQAWRDSIDFFARYRELRGEMHGLFEQIRARDAVALESAETRIWGTWDEVEAAARRHGAMEAEEN